MEMLLFTVYDVITDTYSFPFSAKNKTDATRSFRVAANDPKTSIGQNPQDYSLYYLGTYNDENASFTQDKAPELVVRATSILNANGAL